MFVMAFWAAAQLQPQRDQLALHCLKLFGFETYAPRLRDQRTIRGRKVIKTPLLFPAYRTAMQSGTMVAGCRPPGHGRDHAGRRPRHGGHLVQGAGSERPDRVATSTSAIQARGLRACSGRRPFANRVELFAGMRPHEREAVLLKLLGGIRRVDLPDATVARWP
jgi:hypothetical protein